MIIKKVVQAFLLQGLVTVCILVEPLTVRAATMYEDIDGGACLPEVPYNGPTQTFTAVNWQHWLYGFEGSAFCHLTMPNDWPVNTLSYVLFTGISNQKNGQPAVLTAHLCVHSFDLTVSCGPASTISGGDGSNYQVNTVLPPSPMPPTPVGAFVEFNFPPNSVSTVNVIIPVWIK